MAALRARELDPAVEVTMLVADRFPNFSVCGLPFYVSGEVADWRSLAHRSAEEIAKRGIDLRLDHSAVRLSPGAKTVVAVDGSGRESTFVYDTVIVATGARPRVGHIEGVDLPGVYPLHTMEDSFKVRTHLDELRVKQALIVGSGYIGLEMADAFRHRGIAVTLAGRSPTVMPAVDDSLGAIVRAELEKKPTYLPLGTTAHKQGRVAGEIAAGGEGEFQGSVGTQVVKVFQLAVARTGLRDDDARANGFDPLTVEAAPWHHKVYYPGAHRLHIRITGDSHTGRLLGAQIVGHWQAEVAKRIDVFATALFHGMTVEGVSALDLSYTPPMGAPWDAVQEAAQAWVSTAAAAR
jgi:NADPH-dependent 2,4-dienoyl-CoA reductase/sulfur reductase-like enzyme